MAAMGSFTCLIEPISLHRGSRYNESGNRHFLNSLPLLRFFDCTLAGTEISKPEGDCLPTVRDKGLLPHVSC